LDFEIPSDPVIPLQENHLQQQTDNLCTAAASTVSERNYADYCTFGPFYRGLRADRSIHRNERKNVMLGKVKRGHLALCVMFLACCLGLVQAQDSSSTGNAPDNSKNNAHQRAN